MGSELNFVLNEEGFDGRFIQSEFTVHCIFVRDSLDGCFCMEGGANIVVVRCHEDRIGGQVSTWLHST